MSEEVVPPVVNAPAQLEMPAHGSNPLPANPAPAVADSAPAVVASPKKEVFFAGKKFDSEADALAYASSFSPAPAPAAPPAPVDTAKELSELIFTDPAAYHRISQEETIRKMEQKYAAQKQLEETWNGFYQKNPDLQGFKDLVAGAQSVLWNEVSSIPVDQALDRIAKHARGILQRAGAPAVSRERLGNNGAGGASPSPATGPAAVPQPQKTLTFVEEMKQLRSNRKKIS